ncbi:MAG: hypothetical protein ABUK01_09525 [Leptospirales bacterium]
MSGLDSGYVFYPLFFVLMGFRHGMDADHIAALSDIIGIELERKRQLLHGLLYAVGHASIVLCFGFAAALLGMQLSDSAATILEFLVGFTLLLLGGLILISVYQDRSSYVYKSRISLVIEFFRKKFPSKEGAKIHTASLNNIGAFFIGVLHGIGAETPTQLTLFASSMGLKDIYLILFQILMFTVGLFVATLLIIFSVSWLFQKASKRKKVYLGLGIITGAYSVLLGSYLIWQSFQNGGFDLST